MYVAARIVCTWTLKMPTQKTNLGGVALGGMAGDDGERMRGKSRDRANFNQVSRVVVVAIRRVAV